MKNWKKYLVLLTVLLLTVAFAACAPAQEEPSDPPAEQTQAPTETPTEVPTEEPTEALVEMPTQAEIDYSSFKGNWYSGAVALIVKEDAQWEMTENGEVFLGGRLTINEEGALVLYDVEGIEAAHMRHDDQGALYAELYVEELYERISDFIFTAEKQSADTNILPEDTVEDNIVVDEPVEDITEIVDVPVEG